MNVLMLGAGGEKGLMIMPDVDDRVVVLCAQEDPAQGVVLGGLYGVNGPPDSGVEGTAVQRYTLQTPGGQRVRLDDAKKLVRIENQHGSFLEMTPSKLSLHAHGDLQISAPGHTVTISAKAINFEEA
jgi:phage baseplate assembly protein gpV